MGSSYQSRAIAQSAGLMFLLVDIGPMAKQHVSVSLTDVLEYPMTVHVRKAVILLMSPLLALGLFIAAMAFCPSRADPESILSSVTMTAQNAVLNHDECGAYRMAKDDLARKSHFIDMTRGYAAQAANELGIPTEWVIAQWALETGYTLNTNNNLAGLYAYQGSPFGSSGKSYLSLEDFTIAYISLLKNNSSYALALHASNTADYAKQLGLAGYAGAEGAGYADNETWSEAVYLSQQAGI